MRCNDGKKTKKITIVVPESVEIIDLTYYWKTQKGRALKTQTTLMDVGCEDGTVRICYEFPREDDESE
jgi:hypothetical protein